MIAEIGLPRVLDRAERTGYVGRMCGRASLTASPKDLKQAFGLDRLPPVIPRYNIAPTEPILLVRAKTSGGRESAAVRWGPGAAGAEDARAVINLRLESARKGAMKSTLRQRRCIVPLTGFYEWKRVGKQRQPFNVRLKDGQLFGLAGIRERLESGDAAPLESCLMLTTAANAVARHGGKVWAESEPNRGATFLFSLASADRA
jgi:putative SOS response-associated peptidase YedK